MSKEYTIKKTFLWVILIPAIVGIILCLLFYCSLLYSCYPYQGSSRSIEEIVDQYSYKFRDIPKEFCSFPTVGLVNWNYDAMIFNCRNIYGYYDTSRIDSWLSENKHIFEDIFVQQDETLKDYYELMVTDSFKTSNYFNLPFSKEKFVKIGYSSTKGRLKVYLYISRDIFLICFR
jgi:hypothetical protein